MRYHLGGEIGGRGDIVAKGDLGPRDHRLNVVCGKGEFNAVAGKVLIREANRRDEAKLHFDLVR